jgi:hypothetical protein
MALASSTLGAPVAIVVWLDHWHALIARSELGRRAVIEVDRDAEPETAYLRRVAEAAHDGGRLMVLGPDDERLAFDREYETLFVRTDRFVEVEASSAIPPSELIDRLRFLEGDGIELRPG